jgi:hypothetical protein
MRRTFFVPVGLNLALVMGLAQASEAQTTKPTIHRVTVQPDAGVLTIVGRGLGPNLLVTVEGQPAAMLPGAVETQLEVLVPAAVVMTPGTYRLTVVDPVRRVGDGFVVAIPIATHLAARDETPGQSRADFAAAPPAIGAEARVVQLPRATTASPAYVEGNCVTAIGVGALVSNTSGCFNTASGAGALNRNTTGERNTASGQASLFFNTTGAYNTASGSLALHFSTTGTYNTASGSFALFSNTIGGYNTASGSYALYNNTSGVANAATGAGALQYNTTGARNTATGFDALFANTTGSYNVGTGEQALGSNTSGDSNTASGAWALQFNTTGGINTATGVQALWNNTTGVRNTASGGLALAANTTGQQNTASGGWALAGNTTGHANAALGYNAGANATTGSYNVFLGADVVGTAADTNTIRIGRPYDTGTGAGQNQTFIAGIRDTQLTGSAVQVFIDANGQLGTLTPPVGGGTNVTAPVAMLQQQVEDQRTTIADLRARLARLEALVARTARRR